MTTLLNPLQDAVRRLARERNAVILAHNYQVPEIQDVADFVGDSLGLAIEARKTDAPLPCRLMSRTSSRLMRCLNGRAPSLAGLIRSSITRALKHITRSLRCLLTLGARCSTLISPALFSAPNALHG